MKVKVIKEFRDLYNFATVYKVGSEVEFKDERAKQLIESGICEEVKTDNAANTAKLAAEKAAAEKAEIERLAAEKAAKITDKQQAE